jgi:hypothetical protein
MKCRIELALFVAIVSVACTNRDLTREHAADLIRALDGFKQEPYFWIRTEMPFKSIFKCESQATVERAPLNQFVTKMNWVRYETRSTVVGFDTKAPLDDTDFDRQHRLREMASRPWIDGGRDLVGRPHRPP